MMYLVTYDVAASRRRSKVLDALRDFGTPVQRSVVECELTPERAALLWERVQKLIRKGEDQVRLYPLCQACYLRSEVWGPDPIPLAGPLAVRKRTAGKAGAR